MKDFLIKSGETIVQTVRDYPKGTLIVAGVLIVLAKVF
jgi:hypothetical protein